jgi:hypothetical protein
VPGGVVPLHRSRCGGAFGLDPTTRDRSLRPLFEPGTRQWTHMQLGSSRGARVRFGSFIRSVSCTHALPAASREPGKSCTYLYVRVNNDRSLIEKGSRLVVVVISLKSNP